MKYDWAVPWVIGVLIGILAFVVPRYRETEDPILELRKTTSVQKVEIQDLKERVETLEKELDLIAPRTPAR